MDFTNGERPETAQYIPEALAEIAHAAIEGVQKVMVLACRMGSILLGGKV